LHKMIIHLKRIIYLMWLLCLPGQTVFSQNYSSKNNHTGDWETSSSWNPIWPVPLTTISGLDITINGYMEVNGTLTFQGSSSRLIINDTLVINGNLLLENNSDITIRDNGILIVLGDCSISNQTVIIASGYFIITGNLTKSGSQGSLVSNDNPVKVFIGGTISPSDLTRNNFSFPVLNCLIALTTKYPGTGCCYGNLTDLANDPINSFFQSTLCTVATPTISASGPLYFCSGGNVSLTSSIAASYLWSTGATTQSISVDIAGSYSVKVKDNSGCRSAASVPAKVIVNERPVAYAGPDQVLNFVFETRMNAVLAESESGAWSLISGSGHINDILSPTTLVTELSVGENVLLWKVKNGNCGDSTKVKITVNELFVPTVITPDGDGENEYFKIGEFSGKVELIIFNRWGVEEFTNSDYLNDWNGNSNKGIKLPNDTYFYMLKFENGWIKKGSVLIKR
jgi:gliding motility-associated-like protein